MASRLRSLLPRALARLLRPTVAADAPVATPVARARDSQRTRLYRAEALAPRGQEMPRVPRLQRALDEVVGSAWFGERYGSIGTVVVDAGAGNRRATHRQRLTDGVHILKLPRWARCRRILLHELAHAVVTHRQPAAAPHGPEFARVLLDLVGQFQSPEDGAMLADSFRNGRIRVAPPTLDTTRKRPGSQQRSQAAFAWLDGSS